MSPQPTRSIADLPTPPRLPLIGNAHQLARTSRIHSTAERWATQYGPIIRVDLGRRRIVGLADAEEIHRILRERPDGFRRWREQETVLAEMGPPGVFAAEGEDWKRQRRLVITALNTNHLHRYFQAIRTTTGRLHTRLTDATQADRAIDISDELTSYTLDTISWLAFGHDLNTLDRGDSELQQHIQRLFHMLARRLAAPVPYWRFIKLPADRALDRSVQAVDQAIKRFIEQARERMAARPELREQPENMLEAMLAAQQSEGTFTDEEIAGNVLTLMIAGEDTTAHTLGWTVWFLASNPEVQERLANEAQKILGEHPYVSDHDALNGLHYGEAVLRESMHLKTVGPLLTLEPLADTTICDTHIPANTRLLLLLRRANLQWRPADQFDPDRWLREDDASTSKSLVFGAGPRFCPGRNLAFLEAKSALAMIARNFHIELDDSTGPVHERFNFAMIPDRLRVRLRSREHASHTPVPAAEAAG
ncbi:MAG: cytochrome P450 [Solirubrobacteraceae bacterium]